MMVNKNKIKGSAWEREFAKAMNETLGVSTFKRVPGSGALGTVLGEASLKGDVKGEIDWLSKSILVEAKTGYGGSKQLTVKKEWFDKIAEEALSKNAIPLVACKFSDARSGVRRFVALDYQVFADIILEGQKLKKELDKVYEELSYAEDRITQLGGWE